MAPSNAEKQARWRERNVVALTDDARIITSKLIDMDDQAKLRRIAGSINDHLKHPDATSDLHLIMSEIHALVEMIVPSDEMGDIAMTPASSTRSRLFRMPPAMRSG
jgi:hypothetical protein